MDLKDTIDLMVSDDYTKRFKAEYLQTKIRCSKLKSIIERYNDEDLGFSPKSALGLLEYQLETMRRYLRILEQRAGQEGIDLNQ